MSDVSIGRALVGRLTADSLPFVRAWAHPTISEIIAAGAGSIVVIAAVALVGSSPGSASGAISGREWLTSRRSQNIGIMYIVVAFVMLTRALIEAVLMRTQQALRSRRRVSCHRIISRSCSAPTARIMVFFMAMPFLTGLINYVMPLQIGARDVAFPVLNSVSLCLTGGAAPDLMMISLVVGRILDRRLERLSALYRARLQPRRRARLLDLGGDLSGRSARP